MLTKVQAYSQWPGVDALILDPDGQAETDFLQILNIDGLEPVKASISTSPYGSLDGASVGGNRVDTRNIVLTIRPNPDWNTWTFASLRKILYLYFMPKSNVKLVFDNDDPLFPPVEIYGYVETCEANSFSKTPEYQVSIICPDPYFTAIDPIQVNGAVNQPLVPVEYDGDVEIGIHVKVTYQSGSSPNWIYISANYRYQFFVPGSVSAASYFEMNSMPRNKYVRGVNESTSQISNLLSGRRDKGWAIFKPGDNAFRVETDQGIHNWVLTYFKRYGGL